MAQATPKHDPARDDPKPEESRRDWEDVQTNDADVTERLKVSGGWLYRTMTVTGSAIAVVFVPNARA